MGERGLIHNFQDSLRASHVCEDNPCWLEIYTQAFPTMQTMVCHRKDGDHQRAGIDRSVILENSKQILIDEKARFREDTGDIMLEYISNDTKGTQGWVEKPLRCDYIAYAFIPSGVAYLFPVIQLQAVWVKNRDEWLLKYGTKAAKNHGYSTLNCPVPTKVVMSAIGKALKIQFTPGGSHVKA